MSTASGTSATLATENGLPLSSDSISANSSRLASSRSASFQISCPRCEVDSLRLQGPSSKALRAAVTARSTSSLSASGTRAITSPVAGLYTGKVLPDAARTKRPSISMRCCREKNSAVLEVMRESTGMVAIKYLRRGRQEVVLGWDAADVLRRRNDSTGPEAQSSGRPVTKETAKIQTCNGQQICGCPI